MKDNLSLFLDKVLCFENKQQAYAIIDILIDLGVKTTWKDDINKSNFENSIFNALIVSKNRNRNSNNKYETGLLDRESLGWRLEDGRHERLQYYEIVKIYRKLKFKQLNNAIAS